MNSVELLIVGAGPAGMAAAITARKAGLEVLVVDEQPAPGGQIWRGIETIAATKRGLLLGSAYLEGHPIVEAFRASGAVYEPGMQLWQVEPGFRAFVSRAGVSKVIEAEAVILATGAQERPAPFKGWTLPGVLTVGAAQILLKNSEQIPAKPVIVAGSGPLVLLYMRQLLKAGGKIAAFLDTTPPQQLKSAIRFLPSALLKAPDLLKGLSWSFALKLAGVRRIRGVNDIEALGTDRLTAIRFRTKAGVEETVETENLLVHEGVVPNVHASFAVGCAVEWRADQQCFAPTVDEWGETSQAAIYVAGDGAGIGGAKAAYLRGEIAALGVATKLGRLPSVAANKMAASARSSLRRELALRRFLDALFRPREAVFNPTDQTVVCRCEELTAGEIRNVVRLGRRDPNQIKALTRVGMGPCQGRQCGYSVTQIVAAEERRQVSDVGFYRFRPPLKPITLGELASLRDEDHAI
ncbi:FAD/NAD(P)-binding oxidoreductase [Metarhizobium album]|uniref:FAD/NAD(P)-binding oxidoreductase n=1 Tax=Metarhizobium album TaxID=2182425 RepID=A0A2U2DK87_9HYPH|nr:NAD(P)/FAD-dependent oxidoreductase [Rhizobium album]PWE53703.1 FAD/NAD(P)-binding oxidoreductase [Rhizobium album]